MPPTAWPASSWAPCSGYYTHACDGAIAQLGERLLCKQEVTGSIPVGSMKKTPGNELFFNLTLGRPQTPTSLDGLFDGLNLII